MKSHRTTTDQSYRIVTHTPTHAAQPVTLTMGAIAATDEEIGVRNGVSKDNVKKKIIKRKLLLNLNFPDFSDISNMTVYRVRYYRLIVKCLFFFIPPTV